MKNKKQKFGFQAYGTGPVIDGVKVQYTSDPDELKQVGQTYGVRGKGFGVPKHSWLALARVFKYVKPDLWRLIAVLAIAILSVAISLGGSFMMAPLIDSLMNPAVGAANGWVINSVSYGSAQGYFASVLSSSMALYKVIFEMVDWSASNASYQAMDVLGIIMGAMVILYVISLALGILQAKMMIRIGTRSLQRMRDDMFAKLQDLPVAYFDHTAHGDIMSRFTNDVDNIAMLFINGMLEIFTSMVVLVGILVFIFVLNWLLALVSVLIEAIAVALVAINVHRSVKAFSDTQVSMGEFNGFAQETLSGLKTVKCFNKEGDMNEIFKAIDYRHTKDMYRSVYLSSVNIPMVNNINNIATAVIALIGAIMVAIGADIPGFYLTVGSLVAFIAFLRQFSRPFNSISNMMTMIQASLAGAERIFQMMDQKPEPSHASALWRSFKAEDGQYYWTDGKDVKKVLGDVKIENVDFSYFPGQPVLKNITLYAHPGQRIALVGSTGAGKTTITNMLTRFYDIDAGTIYIDGINLKDIDRVSMRRSMTLVLQDTHLFTGTIYDNIRFGRLKASDEDCQKAAKIACADKFIEKLPQGYNTVISGEHSNLSQGEKQLLSIARCAVSNPPILILDEATSSVDTRTERLISKGMDNLMMGKTTFVIAHRLSTIRYADCIMVMDHGQIIERGTHDQLIAMKGRYYNLWTGKAELQ